MDEWIKKMWYIYAMEYYSAIKKNKILSFATKWMKLEIIMLSKISQIQNVSHVFSHLLKLEFERKTIDDLKVVEVLLRMVVGRGDTIKA
jgi:hypothetical protein